MSGTRVERFSLGPMPSHGVMTTVDEQIVRAPLERIFALASDVAAWPRHLAHYRFVRFRTGTADGGGIVEMSANRPFGAVQWPTWWVSQMAVTPPLHEAPCIRFRHIEGITTGMDVAWEFARVAEGTHVRVVHVWNGPRWPLVGRMAARQVIGPVFVHGIASRTLAGLARAAEGADTERTLQRGTA